MNFEFSVKIQIFELLDLDFFFKKMKLIQLQVLVQKVAKGVKMYYMAQKTRQGLYFQTHFHSNPCDVIKCFGTLFRNCFHRESLTNEFFFKVSRNQNDELSISILRLLSKQLYSIFSVTKEKTIQTAPKLETIIISAFSLSFYYFLIKEVRGVMSF